MTSFNDVRVLEDDYVPMTSPEPRANYMINPPPRLGTCSFVLD